MRKTRIFHPAVWGWGDEQSIIGRIPVFDYDFSPAGLKDFRHWLQAQYGTLEALNKQWHTTFSAWDQVIPAATGVRGEAMIALGQ